MKTEQELEITRFKIIEPFLKKEKKIERDRTGGKYLLFNS